MSSLSFFNRNNKMNTRNSNLNCNFHNTNNIEINSNIPTHGAIHIFPRFSRPLPVSIISSSNTYNPGWQLLMLDDNSKRVRNQTETAFWILTDNVVLLTESSEHHTRINDNRSNCAAMRESMNVSMCSNELALPLTRNQQSTSIPRTVFQNLALVKENPQNQSNNNAASSGIPSSNVDFSTQYTEITQLSTINVMKGNLSQDRNGMKDKNGSVTSMRLKNDSNEEEKQVSANNRKNSSHTNKRYTCKHCHKELFNSTGLRHHTYTHTNEWPFRCCWPGCTKGTATKRDLTKHQRIHTGEKPFMCDICNKKFSQSGVMHRHRKVCATKNITKDMNGYLHNQM